MVTATCVWLNLVGVQALTLWQLKQLAVVGTWLLALPVAVLPLWQLVQLVAVVKVLWSTFAPVHTVVDLWQVSQAAVVWTCPEFLPTAGGKLPLWQLAQLVVTVTFACNLAGAQVVKLLWQVPQVLRVVGMWLLALPVAVEPLWQVEQLVAAVNVEWSTLAPVHTVVELWQVSQAAVVWMWPAFLPTAGGKLPVWQDAHCALIETLLWNRAGDHAEKPPLWHVSQFATAAPLKAW